MRGNGLEATSYIAIADLDPRVADNMLEILREEGVAAYAEPCLPQQGLLLEVTLPPAPLDRLHVDQEEALRARGLLRKLLAGSNDDDADGEAGDDTADTGGEAAPADDLVWAQLVEAYEQDSKLPVAPWPTSEDAEDADEAEDGAVKTRDRADDEADDDSDDRDGAGAAAPAERAAKGEERYVPPPPPPLPKLDPVTKVCWAVLLAGPALMLLAAFASAYVPSWFLPLGVVAFVGGFILLVLRMRGGPPDESDDGAVV